MLLLLSTNKNKTRNDTKWDRAYMDWVDEHGPEESLPGLTTLTYNKNYGNIIAIAKFAKFDQ